MIKASKLIGPLIGPLTVHLGLWCKTTERRKILTEYRRENAESKATGDFNEFQRVYRLFLFVVLRLTIILRSTKMLSRKTKNGWR